jgi:hypothetical protein
VRPRNFPGLCPLVAALNPLIRNLFACRKVGSLVQYIADFPMLAGCVLASPSDSQGGLRSPRLLLGWTGIHLSI